MRDLSNTVTGLLIALMIVVFCGIAGTIETTNIREATVTHVVNGDTVLVEDKQGYIWEFEGTGYEVGQEVKMYIRDYGTMSFADDEIVKVW